MQRISTYHYLLTLLICLGIVSVGKAQKVVVFELENVEEVQDTLVMSVSETNDGFAAIPIRSRRWNSNMIGRERTYPMCGRLDLSDQGINQLPIRYKGQKRYSYLDLSGNPLKTIRFGKLGTVMADTLIMRNCEIRKWNRKSLPLYVLYLDLSENQLESVPADVNEMYSLFHLDLSNNQLRNVSLMFPENLRHLDLSANELERLSGRSLKGCEEALEHLDLSHNAFSKVPACVRRCESLEDLDLQGNQLTRFNCAPRHFPKLKTLDLRNNAFTPVAVAQLKNTWSHLELLIDEPLADE